MSFDWPASFTMAAGFITLMENAPQLSRVARPLKQPQLTPQLHQAVLLKSVFLAMSVLENMSLDVQMSEVSYQEPFGTF